MVCSTVDRRSARAAAATNSDEADTLVGGDAQDLAM
jgi:hypothetical protein